MRSLRMTVISLGTIAAAPRRSCTSTGGCAATSETTAVTCVRRYATALSVNPLHPHSE